MRRLLCLLIAFALATLPFASIPAAVHASAGHGIEHGMMNSMPASPPTRPDGRQFSAAGHQHHHHEMAAGDDRAVAVLPDMSQHMEGGLAVADVDADHACPMCGPDCHCVGLCATACHPAAMVADAVGVVRASSSLSPPGLAVAPKSWLTRPWPPPPRA